MRQQMLAGLVAAVVASGTTDAAETGTVLRGLWAESAGVAAGIDYSVYLPPGYPDRRYPTLYLLHGFGADDRQWLKGGIATLLDDMIARGEIGPLIAVMPDAGNSWYVDSAAHGGPGDYATAIARDLVADVDHRFATRAERAHRGIAGISMGGFGALCLAFERPETFGAVAGLSAGLFMPQGISWQHGPAGRRAARRDHWYASTFGREFDLDLYAAKTPFAYVDRLAKSSPHVLLIAGDDDGFGAYDGAVELFLELRRQGIKPELRIGDGGHDWRFWRRMLPETVRFFAASFASATDDMQSASLR
jgi:enterochelin esterase family protein